jgi:hypothetical protein
MMRRMLLNLRARIEAAATIEPSAGDKARAVEHDHALRG